jgi:hypothetical protein
MFYHQYSHATYRFVFTYINKCKNKVLFAVSLTCTYYLPGWFVKFDNYNLNEILERVLANSFLNRISAKTPENPPHCHVPLMAGYRREAKRSKSSTIMFFEYRSEANSFDSLKIYIEAKWTGLLVWTFFSKRSEHVYI